MNYFGARPKSEQYIPKKGAPRPGWTYRVARRNLAREMHWPERYRWRYYMRALREKAAQLLRSKAESLGAKMGA